MYEIVLVCPFCDVTSTLGTVSADSARDAIRQAEVRWPDARYEEMTARRLERDALARGLEYSPVESL
jgi:hypothetical protein